MRAYSQPREVRNENLRRTVISSIVEKLQRMNTDQLREIHSIVTEMIKSNKKD